jgi:hypothetical protein
MAGLPIGAPGDEQLSDLVTSAQAASEGEHLAPGGVIEDTFKLLAALRCGQRCEEACCSKLAERCMDESQKCRPSVMKPFNQPHLCPVEEGGVDMGGGKERCHAELRRKQRRAGLVTLFV